MANWMDALEAFEPREIRAALRRWQSENPNKKPNPGHIEQMLREVRKNSAGPHVDMMADITREVAERHGMPDWRLRGSARDVPTYEARAEAIAMCHALGVPVSAIGAFFGNRDHTTIYAALKRWDEIKDRPAEAKIDPAKQAEVADYLKTLEERGAK